MSSITSLNPFELVLAAGAAHVAAPAAPPEMDRVMLFGFLGGVLTLIFFFHQRDARWIVLALAVCLAGMAVDGFIQGDWALGSLQIVWAVDAFRRWWNRRLDVAPKPPRLQLKVELYDAESRMSRMFGPK